MDNIKTKKLSTALICLGMFCALICAVEFLPEIEAANIILPLYLPVFIAVIPLILAFVFIYCGYYLGAAVCIVGSSAAATLGFSAVIYVAAAFLPLVLVESFVVKTQKRLRTSVLVSAAAAILGVVLVFIILMKSTGTTVVDYLTKCCGDYLDKLTDGDILTIYNFARYPDLLTGAVTQQALDATSASDAVIRLQDMLKDRLNIEIVYYVIVYSLTAGYLVYIIPRAAAQKLGSDIPKMTRLKEYELPRKLWLAALAFAAAALIGDNLGIRGFDVLMFTVVKVFTFVFMVQGFCVLLYFFDERKMSKGLRVVLIISTLLFLRSIALPLVGLFENIFRLRQRTKLGKEQA